MINEECLARILNGGAKYPFTEIQWQQLQHQVLSYKYIMAALPVPSDLVLFIKTSLHSSANRLLHQPPHPSIGCNYNFQMGYGRKIDPEPGRCRRTDGKKWRCSKEALPDAKYCERHMHRGRNRSRKPVEPIMATPLRSHPPAIPLIPSSSFTKTLNFSSFTETLTFSSSSSSSSTTVLSSQDHFLLESIPVRKGFGMKDQMSERSFFSESSGSVKTSMGGGSWQEGLVAFGSSSSRQITKLSEYHQNAYSHKQKQKQQEDEGFYDEQLALKLERKDEQQKVMHHFFDDNNTETAATQLSIATPSCAARDFFHFHKHNEK